MAQSQPQQARHAQPITLPRPVGPQAHVPTTPPNGSMWWQITVGGAIALALALGALALVWLLARPLMLLFLGVVIAEALAPLVGWLARGVPRGVAIIGLYVVLLLGLGLLGWLAVPPLINQTQDLVTRAPELVDIGQVHSVILQMDDLTGGRFTETVGSQFTNFASTIVTLPIMVFSSALEIVVVIFTSLYWLLASPALLRFVLSLAPTDRSDHVRGVLAEMGQAMGGYVRGIMIDAVVIGVLAYIGFLLIGLEAPLALAILAGILEVIPYIGPILAAIPVVAVALLHSWTQALIALAFWTGLQQFESNILTPAVMKSQANVSPLLVVFALIAGISVAGVLGGLVAIPLSGALQVFTVRVVAPAVRRWTGAPQPEAEAPEQQAA